MKKIEITHNKIVLTLLEKLRDNKIISGYTSIKVEKSYGSLNGNFEYDHLSDEKYFTFIYEKDEKFEKTIENLKNQTKGYDLKLFYSDIKKII